MLELIKVINTKMDVYLHDLVSEYKITVKQYELLNFLYQAEDNLVKASEVSKFNDINKRLVSLNLNKLEELYLLTRFDDESDKRGKVIILTELGLATCLEINDALSSYEQTILDNFSQGELSEMKQMLSKVVELV